MYNFMKKRSENGAKKNGPKALKNIVNDSAETKLKEKDDDFKPETFKSSKINPDDINPAINDSYMAPDEEETITKPIAAIKS